MILDLHRQPLLARHQTGAARYRPAFHDAVEFEPQIVMQARAACFWMTKALPRLRATLPFGSAVTPKRALGAIGLQPCLFLTTHNPICPTCAEIAR